MNSPGGAVAATGAAAQVDAPAAVISSVLGADGVLTASIDMPGRTMNVFSAGLMDALERLLDRSEQDAGVQSVVITSGKASFLAGADLQMVRGYTEQARSASHEEMFAGCGRLGRMFVRLEESAKPWVAAVNGIALGGGLELALACRQRLVADDARIQLGVPEVRWGLLPGAGGTQRLPRLAPFAAAMEMLLGGRSINPGAAVELGLFNAAVPAAQLLGRAQALARSLHGQPYSAADKYERLAQADVPAWNESTARSIAAQQGVSDERFELYPAYSAICDSVLKGAHLSLAEATAVEMNQFLRLMFSPVAARMIRTLFLERLRAERELAAPAGLTIEVIEHGAISPGRRAWAAALGKLKLTVRENANLPGDVLEVKVAQGEHTRLALRVLDEPAAASALPQAVLAPAGDYGCVLEVVGADGHAAHAAAALAAKLWALGWPTPGPLSVLQRLRNLPLADQALLAAQCAAAPAAGDPVFLDVAACLAGVAPAWSGGPLIWAQLAGDAANHEAPG